MARAWFGGTSDDWMMGTVAAFGATLVTLNALPVTGTCWDSETGGNPITDLLDANGSPITVLTVTGSQQPRFQGPDGVVEIWVDFGAGRTLLQARDQAAAAAAARDEAQTAAGDAATDRAAVEELTAAGADTWLQSVGGSFGFVFTVITASDAATGLPTAATIQWPDGITGTFTGATDGLNGYTGYTATYAGATTKTLTATGITYDTTTGLPLGPTGLAVA